MDTIFEEAISLSLPLTAGHANGFEGGKDPSKKEDVEALDYFQRAVRKNGFCEVAPCSLQRIPIA